MCFGHGNSTARLGLARVKVCRMFIGRCVSSLGGQDFAEEQRAFNSKARFFTVDECNGSVRFALRI